MKYNFVMFASNMDFYKYMYRDAENMAYIKFYSGTDGLLTKPEKVLHSIHVNRNLNRKFKIPFKKVWYYLILKRIRFQDKKPVCYIWTTFFMKDIESGMVDYIRKKQPDSKHVFFFTDEKFVRQDGEYLKKKMDALTVFDPAAAEHYHIGFVPNVYPSTPHQTDRCGNKLLYDICFIGNERGREKKLQDIALLCNKTGLKTAFYLKKEGNAEFTDNKTGIHYISSYMPYGEVLDIVKASKCVLELMVETNRTCSLRVQEAVIYGKKILTDNPCITQMPCCDHHQNISIFQNVEDININFLKEYSDADYHYNGEFSLEKWLHMIEKLITEKEGE